MMFLLYKPIIGLGTGDTPVSTASRMLSVALTAHAYTGAGHFNKFVAYPFDGFGSRKLVTTGVQCRLRTLFRHL
jgi:hypothetical protein